MKRNRIFGPILWVCLLCMPMVLAGTDPVRPDTIRTKVVLGDAIFSDGFESGNSSVWNETISSRPNCSCYFSGDCDNGQFCNWGPAGPFTEDICNWQLPKPNGVPGQGCDQGYYGDAGPICDGHCADSVSGSIFGYEDPALVAAGITIWSEAILAPSVAGGGPVDAQLSAEALALPFDSPSAALQLGRHVADLLAMTAGTGFYDHFCHYEFDHEDAAYFVDLSENPCRVQAGGLTIQALLAELAEPGAGAALISQIADHCPDWQNMFGPRCNPGPGALSCVAMRIRGAAQFLNTPSATR